MKSIKECVVDVREDDMTVTKVIVDHNFINFYKKETGRSTVTVKGLSNFINNVMDVVKHRLSLF